MSTSGDAWGAYIPALDAVMTSCPTALAGAPAIREAWLAWRWFEKGQLAARYPAGIPLLLARAVEELDHGFQSGICHRMRPKGKGTASE